jgi:hypothetical protein
MSNSNRPADFSDSSLERQLKASRVHEDAPEPVIQRALALFQRQRPARVASGLLLRIVAALTFDSGVASPLSFGMRSTDCATRQLLFSAGGHDVDLRICPADDNRGLANTEWVLAGQVLGPETGGTVLVADSSGVEIARVTLSELGEFRLPALSPGSYTVTLKLGETTIVLPAVQVPQAT